MDPVEQIKRLYYDATPGSIERDLTRAVALLKTLPSDAERQRAAVYMDGLAQMKAEWHASRGKGGTRRPPGASRGATARSAKPRRG